MVCMSFEQKCCVCETEVLGEKKEKEKKKCVPSQGEKELKSEREKAKCDRKNNN